MLHAIHFLEIFLPLLYLACVFLYGAAFITPESPLARACRPTLQSAFLVHLAYLVLIGIAFHRWPLASMFEAMTCLAFATTGIYLYLERRLSEKSVGLFILVIVLFFQTMASGFVQHPLEVKEILQGRELALHVLTALCAYSALTLSAVFSVMYLMLYHEIKQRHFGLVYSRMPSLDVLGSFCYHAAQVGFVFLTIAMIAGVIWAQQAIETRWYADPKVLAVVGMWIIYGALILLKHLQRWPGRRVAYFSLAGYTVALFSLIFVNLFLSGVHGFT